MRPIFNPDGIPVNMQIRMMPFGFGNIFDLVHEIN